MSKIQETVKKMTVPEAVPGFQPQRRRELN
jgi:hypothetical protein